MGDPVDYNALAKKHGAVSQDVDYAALAQKHGAVSSEPQSGFSTRSSVGESDEPSGYGAQDLAMGALKGLGHSALGLTGLVSEGINRIPYIGETLAPRQGIDAMKNLVPPPNTPGEKVGHTLEQVGEFLVPGGAEEKAGALAAEHLPQIAKVARPLARMGTSALITGTQNKIQGGDFGTGALVGGLASGAGQVAEKVAPKIVESALSVPGKAKRFGRTIGHSVLDETSGIRPKTIASQAGTEAKSLTGQLESSAQAAPGPASTQSAVQVVDNAIAKAQKQNSGPAVAKLNQVRSQLTHDVTTGQPFGQNVSPEKILDLKRGIGDSVKSWTKEEKGPVESVIPQVYHALDSELDRTVQGAGDLNQRISSLIPAKQAAQKTAEAPGIISRIVNPSIKGALKHAGAATIGAGAGYSHGGPEGAVIGGISGLVLPEVLADPAVQVAIARAMRSGAARRGLTGLSLQLDRP